MKSRLAAWVLFLGLSGCAGGPKTPAQPKDIPPISRFFLQELVTRRTVDGLTIAIYNTGSVTVLGGAVSEIKSWAAHVKLDLPVFLIKHPKQGYILFDTGLHPDMETMPKKKMGRLNHFLVPFLAAPGQNIAAQLKASGIAPEQIRWVVISHLHMDHAGMIDAFPQATVLIDRREWEAQRARVALKPRPYEVDPAGIEPSLRLRLVDLSSAPVYGSFDHGEDLFKDGSIFLLDMAGHTPGNMGLWANLDAGPVLLAGDATWILDNHQDLALPLKAHIFNLPQYLRRLHMMRAVQAVVPQLVIFPGHDLMPLKLQPRPDVQLVPFAL